ANRFQLDDFSPSLWKTTDYGASWTKIVNGIAADEFTRVIREDEVRRGLLYAGTERGVWVSMDDGANWQQLQLNLPPVPVHDLVVKEGDLVAGTHGRSFWVLDDLSALRQLTPALVAKPAHLFPPRDGDGIEWGGAGGAAATGTRPGQNPTSGVVVHNHLASAGQKVELEFLAAGGTVIKSYESADSGAARGGARPANRAGLNRFAWD